MSAPLPDLSQWGVSADDVKRAAQDAGLLTPTRAVGKMTTGVTVAPSSPCAAYSRALADGQNAAIVASLKSKCDASRIAQNFAAAATSSPIVASSGGTPEETPASSGLSPVVMVAIGVGLLAAGFVAVKAMKKKGKRR